MNFFRRLLFLLAGFGVLLPARAQVFSNTVSVNLNFVLSQCDLPSLTSLTLTPIAPPPPASTNVFVWPGQLLPHTPLPNSFLLPRAVTYGVLQYTNMRNGSLIASNIWTGLPYQLAATDNYGTYRYVLYFGTNEMGNVDGATNVSQVFGTNVVPVVPYPLVGVYVAAGTNATAATNVVKGQTVVAVSVPWATTTNYGAVKPDGSTITVQNGVISANGGGGGGSGAVTQAGLGLTNQVTSVSTNGTTNLLSVLVNSNQIGTNASNQLSILPGVPLTNAALVNGFTGQSTNTTGPSAYPLVASNYQYGMAVLNTNAGFDFNSPVNADNSLLNNDLANVPSMNFPTTGAIWAFGDSQTYGDNHATNNPPGTNVYYTNPSQATLLPQYWWVHMLATNNNRSLLSFNQAVGGSRVSWNYISTNYYDNWSQFNMLENLPLAWTNLCVMMDGWNNILTNTPTDAFYSVMYHSYQAIIALAQLDAYGGMSINGSMWTNYLASLPGWGTTGTNWQFDSVNSPQLNSVPFSIFNAGDDQARYNVALPLNAYVNFYSPPGIQDLHLFLETETNGGSFIVSIDNNIIGTFNGGYNPTVDGGLLGDRFPIVISILNCPSNAFVVVKTTDTNAGVVNYWQAAGWTYPTNSPEDRNHTLIFGTVSGNVNGTRNATNMMMLAKQASDAVACYDDRYPVLLASPIDTWRTASDAEPQDPFHPNPSGSAHIWTAFNHPSHPAHQQSDHVIDMGVVLAQESAQLNQSNTFLFGNSYQMQQDFNGGILSFDIVDSGWSTIATGLTNYAQFLQTNTATGAFASIDTNANMVITGAITNSALTASEFAATDANKKLVSTLNGSSLTSLNASQLTSGTLPYGTLSGLPGSGAGTFLTNTGSGLQWAAAPTTGGTGVTFDSQTFESLGGVTNALPLSNNLVATFQTQINASNGVSSNALVTRINATNAALQVQIGVSNNVTSNALTGILQAQIGVSNNVTSNALVLQIQGSNTVSSNAVIATLQAQIGTSNNVTSNALIAKLQTQIGQSNVVTSNSLVLQIAAAIPASNPAQFITNGAGQLSMSASTNANGGITGTNVTFLNETNTGNLSVVSNVNAGVLNATNFQINGVTGAAGQPIVATGSGGAQWGGEVPTNFSTNLFAAGQVYAWTNFNDGHAGPVLLPAMPGAFGTAAQSNATAFQGTNQQLTTLAANAAAFSVWGNLTGSTAAASYTAGVAGQGLFWTGWQVLTNITAGNGLQVISGVMNANAIGLAATNDVITLSNTIPAQVQSSNTVTSNGVVALTATAAFGATLTNFNATNENFPSNNCVTLSGTNATIDLNAGAGMIYTLTTNVMWSNFSDLPPNGRTRTVTIGVIPTNNFTMSFNKTNFSLNGFYTSNNLAVGPSNGMYLITVMQFGSTTASNQSIFTITPPSY